MNYTFISIIKQDIKNDKHRNPKNNLDYFTTAFFHHPEELRNELEEAGFTVKSQLAIEGPVWITNNFDDYWTNIRLRKNLLSLIEKIENEPSILGSSAHIMIVGQK